LGITLLYTHKMGNNFMNLRIISKLIPDIESAIAVQASKGRVNSQGFIAFLNEKNIVVKAPKDEIHISGFQNGVKALQKVSGQNAPEFLGYLPEVTTPNGKRPCLLMSQVQGETLAQLRYNKGFNNRDFLKRWIPQIYELQNQYLRKSKVFVPDITSKNFMISNQGKLLRVDFDGAELLDDSSPQFWEAWQKARLKKDQKLWKEGIKDQIEFNRSLGIDD
jgi:hypothetical protein